MEMLFLPHLRETTLKALDGVAEGGPLAPLPRALIQLGLAASVTALDREALSIAVTAAYKRGATPGQVQEVIALVSGLGEIGRASCRERVLSVRVDLGGRRIIKKKNKLKIK